MKRHLILANPRGFCAGVDRAIAIVEKALLIFGSPVYVRHEVVHNTFVVNDLRSKGAIFVEEIEEVPDFATVIFSAHGVPLSVRKEAEKRNLRVFDATCPLVTKVHVEVRKMRSEGYKIIMIGHKGHPEVLGTMGQFENETEQWIYLVENCDDVEKLNFPESQSLAFVSQTTLCVDDTREIVKVLKSKFPNIKSPKKDDICYATQNRQDAVKELSSTCDLIIVVGSPNSSNSNRLREVATKRGIEAYMVDNADDLDESWFYGKNKVGLTAGASAPEILVQSVKDRISSFSPIELSTLDAEEEKITFGLPPKLR